MLLRVITDRLFPYFLSPVSNQSHDQYNIFRCEGDWVLSLEETSHYNIDARRQDLNLEHEKAAKPHQLAENARSRVFYSAKVASKAR